MRLTQSLFPIIVALFMFSCRVQQKIPNYLQKVTDTTGKGLVQIPELRIQKNDLLSIMIFSSALDPKVDAVYNLTSSGGGTSQGGSGTSGFLVNVKGDIEYPKLGTLHVEGLTKEELAAVIRKKLTEPTKLLEDPAVIIRFLNLRVTLMGEVNSQGVVNIPGERVTILEAIGLAGGITDFGKKDAIKILRETNGQREIGYVDLSSKELFTSPFYNLQQNDLIVVEPIPRKAKRADTDYVFQRVSFGLSLLTAIALLYTIFK
jgi:polysaccharide biosynthesis/export protein